MNAILVKTTVISVFAILLLCPLVGCGKAQEVVSEKAIEKAIESAAKKDGKDIDARVDFKDGKMSIQTEGKDGKVDMKISEGQMTITDEEGKKTVSYSGDGNNFTMKTDKGTFTSTSGDNAKVPEGFPKDVPIYAGAKVLASSSMPEQNTYMVQLESQDTLENVGAYYKKEMAAQGWKEESSMSQAGDSPLQMLSCSKGDLMTMIMATSEDGKTMISLTVNKK